MKPSLPRPRKFRLRQHRRKPKPATTERYKNPFFHNTKGWFSQNWKVVNIVLFIMIGLLVVGVCFFTPVFYISVPQVESDNGDATQVGVIRTVIDEQLQQYMLGVVSRRHILLFDSQQLQQTFVNHPYIKEISVRKKFPARLEVRYTVRQPAMVLFNQQSYWSADTAGYVLSVMDGDSAQISGPRIFIQDLDYQVSTQVPYVAVLPVLLNIWDGVLQLDRVLEAQLEPHYFVLNKLAEAVQALDVGYTGSVILYTKSGWKIFFALDQKRVGQQLQVLERLLTERIENPQSLEYIDLRVENWAYYQ